MSGWLKRWLAVGMAYWAGVAATWLGEPPGIQWYAILVGAALLTAAYLLVERR